MALDIDIAANLRPLLRTEYDELVETGALEGARVELLQGVLVEVTPQGVPHADVVTRLTRLLSPLFQQGYDLRVQLPLAAGPADEPEPDLAVVEHRDRRDAHPSTAALVVEVAHSSQRMDLGYKARLYASAGVPDYWVVDLAARRVLVHREPGADGYAAVRVLVPGETIVPLVAPHLRFDVARVVGRA
jgi:Uma2 family endonuclease